MDAQKDIMSVQQKREKIATCVIDLKKGLKRLRRSDIDIAIELLINYDQDLKSSGKRAIGSSSIVESQTKHTNTVHEKKKDLVKAIIVNKIDKNKTESYAYPYNDERMYGYLAAIGREEIKPIGRLIVEDWMKDKYSNEISFISMYATVVTGHVEKAIESVIAVGEDIIHKGLTYKVLKISDDKVFLDRGWWKSRFPINIHQVKPTKLTEVNYFKVDSWEQ